MKVALVNTQTYGGAGVVARRIHQSLLKESIDSLLVSKYGTRGKLPNHFFFKDATLRNALRAGMSIPLLSPIVKIAQKFATHPNLVNRPEGFERFSVLEEAQLTNQYSIFDQADVIHLHWISDFIPYKAFFNRFSAKKFVWTLHDMNPITGGCHHADGCLKFESICSPCPQLKNTVNEHVAASMQESKVEALGALKDDQLIIVSPSRWLLELSKRSKITSRFRHVLIENPSFEGQPFLESREQVRKRLKLPTDKKIVTFAAESLSNPRKGVSRLFDAVRSIPDCKNIVLIGIGNRAQLPPGLNLYYTGTISNTKLLASYFYAADLFATATAAENSPLVVIESLSCGTPVVASDVGGIPELVNSTNGLLFSADHTESLAGSISLALFHKEFDRERIMRDTRAVHDPSIVGQRYVKLYQSILAK